MPLLNGSGGLFGAASDVAGELGVPGQSRNDAGDEYRKPLKVGSFDTFGASLTEGEEVELARLESPAGIQRRWGYGRADRPDNQGYAFGQLFNADGEQIHGEISFEWENSTGRETQVVDELDTEDMDTDDRYNRDAQVPMPERTNKNKADRDQFLVVKFTPDTPAADITNDYAIDAGQSTVRLPATEYDVS